MKSIFGRSVFLVLIIFISYIVFNNISWRIAARNFAVGLVYKKTSHGTAGVIGEYSFRIKEKVYFGEIGNANVTFNKYFIVEFIVDKPKRNRISIQQPIDPQSIVPQPPGGWTECPINEDGSIKEKYKRHKKEEQTEDNQISGVEFSTQDSAQVTKGFIEFLKQHKNP